MGGTTIETSLGQKGPKRFDKNWREKKMKNIKKVVTTFAIAAILGLSASATNAGVIVNFTRDSAEKQCVESKTQGQTQFNRGVIVNLTGVIVNFTGVIVNFTGVIVNYATPAKAECGHLPTGD